MKAMIVGRKTSDFAATLRKNGFSFSRKPELIICHGGDGTLLHAERLYPGVPKLGVRPAARCGKCRKAGRKISALHSTGMSIYCESSLGTIISRLKKREFRVREFNKIEGTAILKRNGKAKREKLVGLNEVQVHNSNHCHAVRFDFCANGVCLEKEIIGDGIIAATAYGSTAYFQAATHKTFREGYGIAFNNTVEKLAPVLFKKSFRAAVKIFRRNGLLIADNNPHAIKLAEGDSVEFKPSKEKARIIEF